LEKEPTYGLHRKKQMPFSRIFKREIFESSLSTPVKSGRIAQPKPPSYGISEEDKISILVDLTQQVFLTVERELKLAGFWESIPARKKLRADIQQILLQPAFITIPAVVKKRDRIISRVMETAESKNDIILYAK
jgi:type I restriction enzyme, R subunit